MSKFEFFVTAFIMGLFLYFGYAFMELVGYFTYTLGGF
jgi:hypothetical protein